MLKKKITSIFLVMIVALAMVPQGALMPVHADTVAHIHNEIEFQSWTDERANQQNGEGKKADNSLPKEPGSYYLTKDVTLPDTWTVPNGTTNLCLNGHRIIAGSELGAYADFIAITGNAELNLYDCGTEEYHFDIIESGLANNITKVTNSNDNDGQTFTGGYIYGSGKAVIGVNVKCGSFNMYGGTIIGNADGGVRLFELSGEIADKRLFNLYGGNILGNTCKLGAGVTVDRGYFTMAGGKISYNTSKDNDLGFGGGVKVAFGSFHMTGGEISNNTARIGGGVSVNADESFNLTGGKIINNVSESGAGGIEFNSDESFSVGGDPVVSGNQKKTGTGTEASNVVLTDNAGNGSLKIKVNGFLKEGCRIGVGTPNDKPVIFTDGYTTYNNTEEPYKYFTSDDALYFIGQDPDSGEAVLTHIHDGIEFKPWKKNNALPGNSDLTEGTASFYLTTDVTLTDTWTIPNGTTNLCLNGHHITAGEGWNDTENKRLIETNDDDDKNNSMNFSVLNLYDCGTEEYYFDIDENGLAMNIRTEKGNSANDGQTFKGGYIYGSGKAVIGVGVNYGEFNMYGGTIIGNGNGGVSTIQYQESIFKLYGGNILGNVSGLGGGVLINNGSFNMTGGKISYNTSEKREYGGFVTGGSGGGVKVETGFFTMSGGEISYNTAEVEGGGVSINDEQESNDRSMTLTGGSIKNNVSKTGAGGIEIRSSDTFLLSGNPDVSGNQMKIDNNTEESNAVLNSGVEIKVNGKLNEGCNVHVKMKKPSENGKPLAFTTKYSSGGSGETAYKNTENPSVYFTSDDTSLLVDLNTSGEAIQGTPHKITITNPSNGSIKVKGSGTEAEAAEEACVTVTATPSGGYELGSISVKDDVGNAVALTGSGNTRTFTMPASDVTVTASFYVSQSSIDPKVSIAGWIYGNYDAAVNAPVVTGNLGEGAVSFTYYTDAGCRTKTTAANSGTAADGGVPVRAGSYWVKADVEETYYYTGGSATAGFTVAKAPLTITADSDSKIYDGTPLTKDTVKCEGLVKGDAVKSVTVSGTQTDAGRCDNVPSDAVIKNGKDSDVTDCYEIAYVNGILEVTKAELTVTAEEKTKVYGEDDPALTYQAAGLAGGEALTGSLERTEGENAGTYEILQGTLAASDNYILTYVPANFTILPKKIIAKADAKTKIEDKKDPKFTYTVEGLVGTDKLKGKLTRKPGELPGKYEILQGTLSASANYDLTYKGAKLTIKPIPVRPAKPDYTLFAAMTAPGFNELILTWASVKDAKGYDIYFGEAGKKCAYAGYVKASDARALHFTGLKVYTVYKAYVKAWKKVKGRKTYIGKASPAVSTITSGYTEKYCNAKSIAVKKAELTVKKGKTGRIKAAVQGVLSDRTVYKPSNLVRYYSSNRKVATVDKDGIVHGKAAGTCKIYAMTNNGIRTSVKITVVR